MHSRSLSNEGKSKNDDDVVHLSVDTVDTNTSSFFIDEDSCEGIKDSE